MIQKIKKCQSCGLCSNQKPLLDCERDCNVFWVGLSAKKIRTKDETPLSSSTNSGSIIDRIESDCASVIGYRTNLVKCLPLNEDKKLRYPNKIEIDSCFENLASEIESLTPKIIFLLGEKVSSSVSRHLDIHFEKWSNFEYTYAEYSKSFFVPIHHPSYIHIYKRKQIDEYLSGVAEVIERLL